MRDRIILVVLVGILMLPSGIAAPQILPHTSSLVLTTNTDYIEFSRPTIQCGTPIVCPLGVQNVQIEIQSPQDQTMIITTNSCLAQPNGVIRVEFDDDVTSSPAGTGGTCGTVARGFGHDESTVSLNDALVGVPADGTWTITIGFEDPYESQNVIADVFGNTYEPIRLSIQGKVLCYGVGTSMVPKTTNQVQLFNWRSAAVGETKDAGCSPMGVSDTITEAFEDPDNGVYFQPNADATEQDELPQTAQGPFTLNCATQTVTITGFWVRGADQVSGSTFVLFRWIEGQFEALTTGPNPTLRNSIGGLYPGHMTTPVVDDGVGMSGDHSAVIQYNNAVGNAYSFEARDANQRENRNGVTQIPPEQCTFAAPPGLTGFELNPHELQVSVSHAQCNTDRTSFTIVSDNSLGAGDTVDTFIIRTTDNTVLLTVSKAQMFNPSGTAKYFIFNRTLGPGTYSVLVESLRPGIGIQDYFHAQAFNVPFGDCADLFQDITDLIPILVAHNNTMHSEHESILEQLGNILENVTVDSMLEFFNETAIFWLMVLLIIWGESKKEFWMFFAAGTAGILAITTLSDSLMFFRIVLIAVVILCFLRGIVVRDQANNKPDGNTGENDIE